MSSSSLGGGERGREREREVDGGLSLSHAFISGLLAAGAGHACQTHRVGQLLPGGEPEPALASACLASI